METINQIELTDESVFPDENVLRPILGKSFNGYRALLNLFNQNEMGYEWRYYRDGKAWLCKVQKNKKTIVWMSAWKGYMKATLYFPDRYCDQIYALNISEETKEIIRKTKNVGKSKPCIFEIRKMQDLADFNEVMQFKIKIK